MFQKRVYNTINITVMAISFCYFIWKFFIIDKVNFPNSPLYYLLILLTIIIVYSIKCVRLYLIIYGIQITRRDHLIQFIKTVSVNTVIPFKTGELFRIYCYGYASKSLYDGTICILLDRFVDTFALVTLIAVVSIVSKISVFLIFYLFLSFLISIVILYFVFPPFFTYWNQFFVAGCSSSQRLRILNILEKTNSVYIELKEIVHSRIIVLYALSLIAWIVEIIGYYFINYVFANNVSTVDIFRYLESAIGLGSSDYQKEFVFISAIISVLVYCILWNNKRIKHKEHL